MYNGNSTFGVWYYSSSASRFEFNGSGSHALHMNDFSSILIAPKTRRLGDKDVPNARNFAAGALNLKEESEFLDRVSEGKLVFIAYEAQENTCQTWKQEMKLAGM